MVVRVKRRRTVRPRARAARLAALGVVAGMVAGAAAAGDIEQSYRKGRIAPLWQAASPVDEGPPIRTAVSRDELDLARTHGAALAAQLGFTGRDECATVSPQLRDGCLDHVSGRGSGRRRTAAPAL